MQPNLWDTRYQTEEYLYGKSPNVFLAEFHPLLVPSGETLSIAEGEGRNAVFLAQEGYDVTAWDYAPAGVEKINRLANERGVHLKADVVDLNAAPWEIAKWDQIINIFGHLPTALRLDTLASVSRAIKPDGFFVSEVYSIHQPPYQSGGPKELDLLYRPEEFLETFKGWRIIHFFMGEVNRQEGSLHKGISHVIQFVGQKP